MSISNINQVPTEELQADLADTEVDISVCELALISGVTTYGTGKSVEYRLNTNRLIREQIKAELDRREPASV